MWFPKNKKEKDVGIKKPNSEARGWEDYVIFVLQKKLKYYKIRLKKHVQTACLEINSYFLLCFSPF